MAPNDADTLRQQIKHDFGETLEDKYVEECVVLCQNFDISAQDLFYKWEAVYFGQSPRVFDDGTIPALRQHVQREVSKQNSRKLHAKSNTSGLMSRNLNAGVQPTPSSSQGHGKATTQSRAPDISLNQAPSAVPNKVKFSVLNRTEKGQRYRYMYERISERSGALDDRIDDIAELVQKHYGIVELGDPSLETEEEVTVVGRIVLDADSSSTGPVKLNESSMSLESSRALGSGRRIPLKFDANVRVRGARKGVQGAGFFPGAIVALRGRNGGGGWFVVTEILSLPNPSSSPLPPGNTDRAFTMCAAAGPYTADADLQFKPWEAFLKKARSLKPSVVLLIGPFIDSNHLAVQNGDLDKDCTTIFREIFLTKLSELLDELPGSIALIVPSVRDILNEHAVFPQGEFRFEHVHDSRISTLSNPCCFDVNGISFGATSVDVLFHLRKEEYFKQASAIAPIGSKEQPHDAMANLCYHIVQQRSFYPIFPVPLDLTHEVNLDISHSDALHFNGPEGEMPNILFLPSKLKQFVKYIEDMIVINPSTIVKGYFVSIEFLKMQNRHVELIKLE
ncbi:hypothetical protein NM688_g320 [Phlebia brevispora]|uniref:Uncharacterized protein n=1 Tax=Phlebia brevispora TaxID=194682 RepID=A0ACC1TEW5_9APHY|nr:hypothetical protein NM688_g320 [Phlebia brevispora]